MAYTIKEHGDLLEKEAAAFIEDKFCNYEEVWKIFVGHTGNGTKAELPNYPYKERRTKFAENSYTVLESSYFIYRMIISKVFMNGIDNFDAYMNFSNSFVSFFAHLGRIHDTVIKASEAIEGDKENHKKFKEAIRHFYEGRNVVLHGKKVPLILDSLRLPKMPVIHTSLVNGKSWHDNFSIWAQADQMEHSYVEDNVSSFFDKLMQLINNRYAALKGIICKELKAHNTQLEFLYDQSTFFDASGQTFVVSGSTLNH
ncbi:MAG TPA: hypothetical protein PL085_14565 [Agriterribacter sp.]|jgi:hypothetical protein|uniref:hypothetical protein n=1 Tax=Agriterribacter sp. TaxID=2821509 RepID=UPI002B56393E|nr:hypothetical protein [Agriterribacter sp.]HRQ18295.1 hypothetical protein [Agriterribacter sp.]